MAAKDDETKEDELERYRQKSLREAFEYEEQRIINCLKRHGFWKYTEQSKLHLGFTIDNLERELKEIKGILEVSSIRDTAPRWKYQDGESISDNLINYMIHLEEILRKKEGT